MNQNKRTYLSIDKWEIKHKKEYLSIALKLLKTAISHFINMKVENVKQNYYTSRLQLLYDTNT